MHNYLDKEKQVSAAIGALDMTRICIAHRPETIAMSRRILRMENGAIEANALSVAVRGGTESQHFKASP